MNHTELDKLSDPTEALAALDPGASPGAAEAARSAGADMTADLYARYPFVWRKTRFPWWVRAGLLGSASRVGLIAYLWGIAALTLASMVVFAIALDHPGALPYLFRNPGYSGAMIVVGVLGTAHYYLTLRWVDQRRLW